ncbi:UDP-N-acetylmuramoyl-L-alanine--D-glutamate ligase [Geofilum rubicundum]|uniref:UDP-N-acetylmuramoylalanine--D-glutamate ligase n=1 Tax=Geofilum rubicundum JCM 15548 TaxID=1236989 RepID=A0A0E9M0H5_9BACT|nr:UDP-N-acetylmuramoyl-L-alanine--D-glutamate ligase [Geofilum rubicundum]GAO30994.1 UDP-N-acetylmuramoylalanine-D-glutamate ligase [Geofilum rubicundum JCM 15548]
MQKELVILGAGESGVGAALLARAKGIPVFVSDNGPIAPRFKEELASGQIPFEEGGHTQSRVLQAGEVVKSPGIPDTAPLIQALEAAGIPVISDIELAGRYTRAHIIGITGSNGKTTTTLWLHHVLMGAGMDAVLSGNVGVSPCRELARRDPAIFVMELSSFQLDRMYQFKVDTAIITNITPDHLDRYHYQFENYVQAKLRILQNQDAKGAFIWWQEDPVLNEFLKPNITPARSLSFSKNRVAAAYVEGGQLVATSGANTLRMPVEDLALQGQHNLYNAMAVALAALTAGAPVEAIVDGLSSFKGVAHRLEHCGEVDGVLYINDSKATNVDSTWYALESMTRPVIWIAGGTDKGNEYEALHPLVTEKVKALICMGVDNEKLIKAFSGLVPEVESTASMEAALGAARRLASPGDVVLLSPACASFDLFKNYEHRGDLFRQMVSVTD